MKAKDLVKKSLKIEEIFKQIELNNDNCMQEMCYPKSTYISQDIIMELISNGFKVSEEIRFNEATIVISW